MGVNVVTSDLRFLLSRVRWSWLPEENNGLAPLGPTGIRRNQGIANQSRNPLSPTWWFGSADTLFPRLTFNRNTVPGGKAVDKFSQPFSTGPRGVNEKVIIGSTRIFNGQLIDTLNPRNISNWIADSTNTPTSPNIGFSAYTAPADPAGLAAFDRKSLFKLQDNPFPAARVSPTSGTVNPLAYSNFMSQLGQFYDHGLDFIDKGVDGKVQVNLLPSDPLYTRSVNSLPPGSTPSLTASRSNTINVTWGAGSSDTLLAQMGFNPLTQQGTPIWGPVSTITTLVPANANGYVYEGRVVLNGIFIDLRAADVQSLVNEFNDLLPTTGVTVTAAPFPAIPGSVPANSYQLTFTPAKYESFNGVSPFVDNSQNIGSDDSKTVFLREYLSVAAWQAAWLVANPGLIAPNPSWSELNTGRLLNSKALVNGDPNSGVANWAMLKANALKIGITLHDKDQGAVPKVATDENGRPILGANGMPQLIALNIGTGEIVYVHDTDLSHDLATRSNPAGFELQTERHAWLNDKAANWTGSYNPAAIVWKDGLNGTSVRDLIDSSVLDKHYVGGDGRLNENIGLTQIHEILLNEHNRVITDLKAKYGFAGEQPVGGWSWTDPLTNVATKITGEELFQEAKLVVEMIYQHMIFQEFNRKLSPNIPAFAPNLAIDARIDAEFASSVYRLGHSMLPEVMGLLVRTDARELGSTAGSLVVTVSRAGHGLKVGQSFSISGVDAAIGGLTTAQLNGTFTVTAVTSANQFTFTTTGAAATGTATGALTDKIELDFSRGLINAFLAPDTYVPGSTAGMIAQGSSNQVGMRIDEKVTDGLRDNLFGGPLDLATLNLTRGRDTGIPTLNEMRASLVAVAPPLLAPGLNPYNSWLNFRDGLKGTLAEQNATVKNFMCAYASDALLTDFLGVGQTIVTPQATIINGASLADWYAARDSTNPDLQNYYLWALKWAAERAFASPTWMGSALGGNTDYNFIDAWIGGLAEKEVLGGMLGSTFDAVFAIQSINLQNADNFYYLGRVAANEFFNDGIDGSLMADLVMRNSTAQYLYSDIFSTPDKVVEAGDVGQPASVATLALLQNSTTLQNVLDATTGDTLNASIGRAGFVGGVFYGNPGNYTDARGALNPNGTGNASEVLIGTPGNDQIYGLGGNDAIYGDGGNDTLSGDAGVDFLHGGDGNDVVLGGTENDLVYGDAGDDSLRGNIGLDQVFGGAGNDTVYGGLEADLINGGAGNDLMYGGDGIVAGGVLDAVAAIEQGVALDDVMHGGSGDDTMYGGGGWDNLLGESGHDILIPGTGGTAVGGGVVLDPLTREAMDGGEGDDIYIAESAAQFAYQDYNDTGLTALQLVNKGAYRVGNGLGVDELRIADAVAGNYVIAAANSLNVAQVFTGIERIVIGTGTGTTAVRTGTAAINVDATLANVGITLGLEILGNAGANQIVGSAFSDTLDGGAGADNLQGGLGDDVYILGEATDVISELGGGGYDTAIIDGAFNYTLAADIEKLTLRNVGNIQGNGNNLDNVIIGGNGNNALFGLAGNDRLDGGAGDDYLDGGDGFDTLTGGAGADRFVFGDNLQIGNSSLLIETVTDFVTANADKLDFSSAYFAGYVFVGVNAAYTGAKQLRFDSITQTLYGRAAASGPDDFQIRLSGVTTLSASDILFANVPIVLNPGVSANYTGTSSSDTITGSNLADTLSGLAGADRLNGLGGNDLLQGGDGNDTMDGGTGIDTLVGGIGDDTYIVDTTTDVLTEAALGGTDTVQSSVSFSITNLANVENLTLTAPAAVNATGNAANNVIVGSTANNSISGAAGNDTLDGGIGNDTLVGGVGADILTGGLGNDRFQLVLTDSLVTGFDSIIDFTIGSGTNADVFDGPSAVLNTAIGKFTFAGAFSQANLTSVLTNANFARNGAALVTFTDGTFLALNNNTIGFQAATDAVVKINFTDPGSINAFRIV